MTSNITNLTDRYVSAVLSGVPSGDRPELEREIRALIADTVDAKAADGTLDADAAERAALTELGDPGALASRYTTGRADYLLGPNVYPVWRALVTPAPGDPRAAHRRPRPGREPHRGLDDRPGDRRRHQRGLPGRRADALLVHGGVRDHRPRRRTQGAGRAECRRGRRTGSGRGTEGRPWTLDDLPDLPAVERISLGELAATIALNVFLLGALVWLQLGSTIAVDGQSTPVFNPALWSFWLPWFIVVAIAEIAFTIAVYLRGRWTNAYAVGNALLGAAFAIPAIYLLANDLLFNPALVDAAVAATDGTEDLDPADEGRSSACRSPRSSPGTRSTGSSRPVDRRPRSRPPREADRTLPTPLPRRILRLTVMRPGVRCSIRSISSWRPSSPGWRS